MKNSWNEATAASAKSDLDLRVYTSQLIGNDPDLVLHGGGNTSVKSTYVDRFDNERFAIWVKASGFDLATMGEEGFTGLDLEQVLALSELDRLSDDDMVNDLKRARLDPDAAQASIEAIVHALVPFKFVDHSHADAVLTVSNSKNGGEILREIYDDNVLILPYVKPGFDLALQFREVIRDGSLADCDAIILEHHGVFTFSDSAKSSYDRMIEIVQVAEDYLVEKLGVIECQPSDFSDLVKVARLRKKASDLAGAALVSMPGNSVSSAVSSQIGQYLRRGTLTPEHVLHNKPFPAMVGSQSPEDDLDAFAAEYTSYFERSTERGLKMLKPHPHWAIFQDGSSRSFGPNYKRAKVSADVANSTLRALSYAEKLGGWQGLTENNLRDIEYWSLEQAKLNKVAAKPALEGKVAIVAGAATGIGLATVKLLLSKGAVVIGLDIIPEVDTVIEEPGFLGIKVDLTDKAAVHEAVNTVVVEYGGIDILIANAGILPRGISIEDQDHDVWDRTLSINLSAHHWLLKQCIPYLRHGVDPGVVFVCSRNVPAPGAGAGAYSVSKAGLTQLMRIAALELCKYGVNVNAVHPDAVFDTPLWSQEALQSSADRYGISIDEYKARNLLKTEIKSTNVASSIVAFVDGTLSKTTGAQLPVDGGNERVI